MKKVTKKALVIALLAGLLVLCDNIIAKVLNQSASFTWIAFVSWTVFFGATTKERFKAVLGYVIGFVAAVLIMNLGSLLNINLLGIAIGSIFATILINFACIELEALNKYFIMPTSGTFVGIAMTFSGLGISLTPNSIENAALMLTIIITYGILGLLCGWATLKFSDKN